uniref:Uncharacterized protein n=1 Tax=Sus scrofa TaxID=9823 RepID=A0A4X1TQP2_PIG
MAATQQRPFRSVVFVVSGFPGKFVTEEVAWNQVSPEWSTRLPWAVAGRCVEKLQRVLERVAMKLDRDCSLKLICAITNPASLDEMAEQAVAVLNCVRPVSNHHFFVLEQGIYSCLAECGSSCSRKEPQVRQPHW